MLLFVDLFLNIYFLNTVYFILYYNNYIYTIVVILKKNSRNNIETSIDIKYI